LTYRKEKHALVALGANLPFDGESPCITLRAALASLAQAGFAVLAASRFFSTPCFPAGAGPDYVNAAAVLAVPEGQGAADVLAALHKVEERFGRTRATRWGMRTLDLDLLAVGNEVQPDAATQAGWQALLPHDQQLRAPDRLILPHPRLQDRAFVLVPLADVAPDWRHPLSGLTVVQMLAALPPGDLAGVQPMMGD